MSYLPYRVYKNIIKFLEYRKLNLISGYVKGDKSLLDENKFIEIIQIDKYIMLSAEDNPEYPRRFQSQVPESARQMPTYTYIIIVEPNSRVANTSNDFEKMIKNVPNFNAATKNFNLDIIVVTKELLKNNIINKIDSYTTFGSDGAKKHGFINISNYAYRVFSMVIPEHKQVPPHRILSKEEAEITLNECFVKKRNIPKITKTDPNAIWHGAITGDVMEVQMPSEGVGINIQYKVCL
jgi:DNA-directed RNA polymerase subunit H (RpoH/RPB5)